MKKFFFLILYIFFIIKTLLYCDTIEDNNINFYVPSIKELGEFMQMEELFYNWEYNKKNIDKKYLIELYNTFLKTNTMQGYSFKSFLRATNNKKIKNIINEYIINEKLNDEFSESLVRLYNSKKVKIVKRNGKPVYGYNYKDEYYDENINLFFMNDISFFDGELNHMTFLNDWYSSFLNKKNEDRQTYMTGGGSNSLTLKINRYNNMSIESFKDKYYGKIYLPGNNFKETKSYELEIKGLHEKSGADLIFVNIWNEDKSWAIFNIYLYSKKLNKGYSIEYSMRFTEPNNNYFFVYEIYSQVAIHLNFTYIDNK